jgi:rod shape-determining protein MreC
MSSSRDDFTIAIRSALLQKGTRHKFSLFFLLSVSLIIFFLDIKSFNVISIVRNSINDIIYRVSNVATSPIKISSNLKDKAVNLIFIYDENKILKKELIDLRAKDFQVEFLKNQNNNLRKTLEEGSNIQNDHTLAKVLLDKDSPYLKSIIINRGSKSGVSKGMPVVDGNYLVGKIVEVNYISSRVLLLNDLNSRIPVTFGEEATQAILSGKSKNKPNLEYLPEQFTPQEGLTVFTSGKDGIFIPGIPIGKTIIDDEKVKVKLFSDPNQLSFVTVQLIKIKKDNF